MTIVRHRPQGVLVAPFNELFNEFFGREFTHFTGSDDVHRATPRVNIIERADSFQLDLLAPGCTKEDLKIEVENDQLSISAEKKHQTLADNERFTRREFGHHAFARTFRLPENTSADNITAEFNNGILSIVIPKAEPSKPAKRGIAIA